MSQLAITSPARLDERPTPTRSVGNRQILPSVLRGLWSQTLPHAGMRYQLFKSLWIEIKRYGAPHVKNVELADVIGTPSPLVEGRLLMTGSGPGANFRSAPLILAALAQVRRCRTIFEFGTYHGETAWTVAHNNPGARVFTLDFEDLDAARSARLELTDPEYLERWERGKEFVGTAEGRRITQLFGDSATFDFSPYERGMDLVYIDASHSYSYVRSDSQAALKMLSAGGTIVWDDYTHYPGIYAYLNQLSPTLDRPIAHILGTRLAIYTRAS